MASHGPDTRHARPGSGPFLESWRPGTGAPLEDREPATGRHLADRPRARRPTTSRAPPRPRRPPSRPGPTTSYQERARVLRRAAEIYEANRDEFGTWTQRETGASTARCTTSRTSRTSEILNAATLPSQPYGSLMPSAVKGRLSMVRRVPVGVIGAITPWNSPSRARACASSRRRSRSATPSSSSRTRRRRSSAARCSPRSSRRRACPTGCSRSSSAAPTSARRSSPTRTSRSCRSPAPRPSGRRVGQLAGGMLKKVSLELGGNNAFIVLDDADLDAAAVRRRVLGVPVPGPGLLRGRPPPRPSQRRRRVHRGPRPRRPGGSAPAIRTARTSSWARSSTRSRSPGSTGSSSARSTAGAVVNEGGDLRGPLLPADRAHLGHAGHAGLHRRDLRPGRPDHGVRHRRGGRRPRQRERVRPGRVDLHALARRAGWRSRTGCGPGMVHVNDGTLNDEAIIPFGGMGESGQRQPVRRRGQPRHVHRVAVGHGARRAADRSRSDRDDGDGIDHRRRQAGRGLAGDGVARRLRVALRGECRDARPGARGGADAGLRPERPGPRAAQELRSRSSGSSSTTSPTRTSRRSSAASRTPPRSAATWSSPAARTAIAEREDSYVRLLRSMRAATVIFAGSGLDDPEVNRRDAQARRRDARLRRGRRPPLAARVRRGGGRRGQRRRRSPAWSRNSSASAIDGSRSWPARPRCTSARQRLDGYRRGLDDAGVPFDERLVVRTAFNREGGALAVDELLAGDAPFTAVCSANDLLALGALAAPRRARDRGPARGVGRRLRRHPDRGHRRPEALDRPAAAAGDRPSRLRLRRATARRGAAAPRSAADGPGDARVHGAAAAPGVARRGAGRRAAAGAA